MRGTRRSISSGKRRRFERGVSSMEVTLLPPHTPSPFPLASPKENLFYPLSLLRGVPLGAQRPWEEALEEPEEGDKERREELEGGGGGEAHREAKKQKGLWMDELNLDNLAKLGSQWWVIRASRVKGYDIAQLLAHSLAKDYHKMEFKIYAPSVNVKRRLKNGSYSVKPKQLFPGCVFLRCVMNNELHDFIREYDGIGGFLGSKVGNM